MSDVFDQLAKMRAEYQAVAKRQGEDAIKKIIGGLFDRFPEIQAMTWYHYTPSFNDGDPCTFTVVGPQFLIDGYEPTSEEIEDEDDDEWVDYDSWVDAWGIVYRDNPDHDWGSEAAEVQSPLYLALKEFEDLLTHNEDVMEQVFGNYVRIIARRDGITVEEHDYYD